MYKRVKQSVWDYQRWLKESHVLTNLGLTTSLTPLQNLPQNGMDYAAANKPKKTLLHIWSNAFFVCSQLHNLLHFIVNFAVGLDMLLCYRKETQIHPTKKRRKRCF